MLELQARIFLSDRLFMAWRSGPTHFASSQVRFVNIRKLLCTFAFLEFSPDFIFQTIHQLWSNGSFMRCYARNWIQCLCLHFPTDQDVHRVVNWLWEDLGKRIRVAYRKRSEGTLFPGSKLYILHFMRISHTVKSKCHVWAKLGKLVIETQYSWTMSFKYVAWHSLAKLSYSYFLKR